MGLPDDRFGPRVRAGRRRARRTARFARAVAATAAVGLLTAGGAQSALHGSQTVKQQPSRLIKIGPATTTGRKVYPGAASAIRLTFQNLASYRIAVIAVEIPSPQGRYAVGYADAKLKTLRLGCTALTSRVHWVGAGKFRATAHRLEHPIIMRPKQRVTVRFLRAVRMDPVSPRACANTYFRLTPLAWNAVRTNAAWVTTGNSSDRWDMTGTVLH